MNELQPRQPDSSRLPSILEGILLALLILQALFFVVHAIQVIRFPHDVDNGEGFLLWQSLQYAEGHWPYQPIEQPPHLVANYPPLYPLLCSLGTGRFGPTFAVGRTLSFVAALGVAFGLGWILFHQSHQVKAAAIAGLFFLGTYHVYSWGAFHRVDLLALLFSVAALATCEARLHWLWTVAACSLAVLTRQAALAAPLAIGCYWLSQHRPRLAIRFWVTLALVVGSVSLLLHVLTGGEYLRHIIVYNRNRFIWPTLFYYARHTWQFYSILCALGLFYLLRAFQQRRLDLPVWFLLFSFGTASLCGKVGSAPNYLLELMTALCWIAGLVRTELRTSEPGTKRWLELLLPALFILQVLGPVHLTHLPPLIQTARFDFAWTPTAEDRRRAEILEYYIRRAEGPVLAEDPGVALRAGRPVVYQPFICTQLEAQGLWDPAPVLQRIEAREFALLVLQINIDRTTAGTDRFSPQMMEAIRRNYEGVDVVPGHRPYYLYQPRLSAENTPPARGESPPVPLSP